MKISCRAIVTEVRESEKYGQSVQVVDLETGGLLTVNMGQARAQVTTGQPVKVEISVKPRPDNSFGNRLEFLNGAFTKE